ncbi:membrane protein [Chryseobacterium formosense]|uniref:Membrane protein n=1 Tax=Chryseobacterium formosense TaxID=236814 RepID=A0A085Z042_9FLAO|nr:hypothetical protein [Chryseobacterium formosense]KFE97805.1 membrane protein [Chryseobacterium formosense]SFT83388.1 hypothetical protein SAMN05421857_3561 [Chryseobacterium formosense]
MGLSVLGIFHTIIGVVAIISALISFVRFGKVNLNHITGKLYFYFTIITSVTALGISKHGGFNAGHALSLVILILISIAFYLHIKKEGNNKARYFENFLMSFSFLLSMLPTVNETLTRVPVGHPLAKDINDPLIGKTLLVIFVLFIAGSVYQIVKQIKINKSETESLHLDEL